MGGQLQNLCLNKATDSQIRHARLPIGRYISLATRKILTVNQVRVPIYTCDRSYHLLALDECLRCHPALRFCSTSHAVVIVLLGT